MASTVKNPQIQGHFPAHVIFLLFPYENLDSQFSISIFDYPLPAADFFCPTLFTFTLLSSSPFWYLLGFSRVYFTWIFCCIFRDWIWIWNRLLLLQFQFLLCYWAGLINSPLFLLSYPVRNLKSRALNCLFLIHNFSADLFDRPSCLVNKFLEFFGSLLN